MLAVPPWWVFVPLVHVAARLLRACVACLPFPAVAPIAAAPSSSPVVHHA